MKKDLQEFSGNSFLGSDFGILRKALTVFLLMTFFGLSFQQESKAETYTLLEVSETNVQISVEGMNLGLWPFNYTNLH